MHPTRLKPSSSMAEPMKVGHLPFRQHEIDAAPQVPLFLFQQTFFKITTLHMGLHLQMFNIIFR